MKNFLLATILVVISIKALAQTFEGTMVWSMNMEITDPATKAQLEESQKAMQDPQKIKELEEQMKSPEFQAMMEKNPQMKAHLERTLASLKGGGNNSLIPTGMVVKISGKNTLTKMEGGIMPMEVLHKEGEEKSYFIDRNNKTYWEQASSELNEDDEKPDYVVTKTAEKKKILNYNCTRYNVVQKEESMDMKYEIWATTEIKDIDFKKLAQSMRTGNKNDYFMEIDGVPMLMKVQMPQGEMTMQMQKIERGGVPTSIFTIPSDFKKVQNGFSMGE